MSLYGDFEFVKAETEYRLERGRLAPWVAGRKQGRTPSGADAADRRRVGEHPPQPRRLKAGGAMSVATGIIEAVPVNPAGLRPIVGRDQDLDRLTAAAGIAPAGGSEALGGLVVLSGDAGMGKTRLLAELAARAGDDGWRVVVGHCLGEAGSTLPYLPFVELLGRLFSDEPEVADDLIAAHPSLGPAPAGPPPRALPPRRRSPTAAISSRACTPVSSTLRPPSRCWW